MSAVRIELKRLNPSKQQMKHSMEKIHLNFQRVVDLQRKKSMHSNMSVDELAAAKEATAQAAAMNASLAARLNSSSTSSFSSNPRQKSQSGNSGQGSRKRKHGGSPRLQRLQLLYLYSLCRA